MEFRHHLMRNDRERRMWVMNDEGMYNWFTSQRPRVGITTFIRNNRQEIDEAIEMYMRRSAENANRSWQ